MSSPLFLPLIRWPCAVIPTTKHPHSSLKPQGTLLLMAGTASYSPIFTFSSPTVVDVPSLSCSRAWSSKQVHSWARSCNLWIVFLKEGPALSWTPSVAGMWTECELFRLDGCTLREQIYVTWAPCHISTGYLYLAHERRITSDWCKLFKFGLLF